MLRQQAEWIAATALSKWLLEHLWVVPAPQSIHIVAVGIVFGSAGMIRLRLLGVGASGRRVSQLAHTLVPWMYRALCVSLLTGTVQIIAETVRQFVTPAFW